MVFGQIGGTVCTCPARRSECPTCREAMGSAWNQTTVMGIFFDGIIVRGIGYRRPIANSEIGACKGRGNSIVRGQLFIVAGRDEGGFCWAGVARRLHQAGRRRKRCGCCFATATRSTGDRVYRAAGLVGRRIFCIRYKQIATCQNYSRQTRLTRRCAGE